MDIKGIENVREHKILRKWDIIALLVFVMVLIALVVVLVMPKGSFVEIYLDGNLKYRLSLSDKGEYNINDLLTVVIDDEGVFVKSGSAKCPDKLCEKQGHIHTNGASIVCLPNKITIVIKGDSDDVDVVT